MKILVALAALFVVASFGGCTGFGKVLLYKPTANGSVEHSYLFSPNYRVPHIHLSLPAADIAIEGDRVSTSVLVGPVLPFIPWPPGIMTLLFNEKEPDLSLRIHIRLVPKDIPVLIHPQKIVLLFEDDRRLLPVRVQGPVPLETKRLFGVEKTTYVCNEAHYGSSVEFETALAAPACLTLEYDISAVPDRPFTLLMDGLSASSNLLEILPVHFARHSQYDIYAIVIR